MPSQNSKVTTSVKSPKGNTKLSKIDIKTKISSEQKIELLKTLEERFKKNMKRHKGIEWPKIKGKLESNNKKLLSLLNMENTGGEPDVVGYDKKKNEYVFCDCSEQSPQRRSICYTAEGQKEREKKGIHPAGNAITLAKEMGIEILSEDEYRELQQVGEFDTKTSSWLKTPENIGKLGGAIFGDRRYDTVFIYHNGAESFYAARGFRAKVIV